MAERRYPLTDIYREQTKGQAQGMFLLALIKYYTAKGVTRDDYVLCMLEKKELVHNRKQ